MIKNEIYISNIFLEDLEENFVIKKWTIYFVEILLEGSQVCYRKQCLMALLECVERSMVEFRDPKKKKKKNYNGFDTFKVQLYSIVRDSLDSGGKWSKRLSPGWSTYWHNLSQSNSINISGFIYSAFGRSGKPNERAFR